MLEKAESMLNGKSSNAKRICAQIQDCLTSVKNCCRLIVIATTSMPHLIDASFKQGSRFSYEVDIIIIISIKFITYYYFFFFRFISVFLQKKSE